MIYEIKKERQTVDMYHCAVITLRSYRETSYYLILRAYCNCLYFSVQTNLPILVCLQFSYSYTAWSRRSTMCMMGMVQNSTWWIWRSCCWLTAACFCVLYFTLPRSLVAEVRAPSLWHRSVAWWRTPYAHCLTSFCCFFYKGGLPAWPHPGVHRYTQRW